MDRDLTSWKELLGVQPGEVMYLDHKAAGTTAYLLWRGAMAHAATVAASLIDEECAADGPLNIQARNIAAALSCTPLPPMADMKDDKVARLYCTAHELLAETAETERVRAEAVQSERARILALVEGMKPSRAWFPEQVGALRMWENLVRALKEGE